MSTKIYTGFKFKTNDIYEARKQIREFKTELYKLAQKLYYKTKVSEAVAAIDFHDAGMMEEKVEHPLSSASDVIENQQAEIQQTQKRNPAYDFSFSLTVFPIEAEDRDDEMHCPKTLLGIFYCDNQELQEFFWEQEYWDEYVYQNVSDCQVEELGEEEWECREYHWELAMPFSATPAQSGFTIDLIPVVNGFFFTFREDAPDPMDFVPSLEERAKNLAREQIGRSIFDEAKDPSEISMFDVIRAVNNEEKVLEVSKGILPKLKKVLTKTDLYGFDPDAKKDKKGA